MNHTDTLRMPEHVIDDDFAVPCRGGQVPGYAHMNPDGTLHCNRCGWVTPEPVITAYSPDTDRTYLTWDELVTAESNGVVVVGTCSRPGTVPVVVGPFPNREEARKAQARLRRRWRAEENRIMGGQPGKITTYVRPLWKENRK